MGFLGVFIRMVPVKAATPAYFARMQFAYGYSYNSQTVNVTLSNTPSSGNVLVATVDTASNSGSYKVTSASEVGVTWNTSVEAGIDGSGDMAAICYGIVGSSASKQVQFTVSANVNYGLIAFVGEYYGISTSTPVDKVANNTGTFNTGTTATTQTPNELWVGTIESQGAQQAGPWGNGFSIVGNYFINTTAGTFLEKIVSTTGTAWTNDSSGGGAAPNGCIATFLPSGNTIIFDAMFNNSPNGVLYANGTVETAGSQLLCNNFDVINLTGVASSGYIFHSFNISGSNTYTSNPMFYTISSQNVTINADFEVPVTIGSVVAITNSSFAVRWQGKSYYAAGLYWVFFLGNTSTTSGIYSYTSSPNGVNWATPTVFFISNVEDWGENLQVILDSYGNFNIFGRTANLYYGYATPETNGSLYWITPMAQFWAYLGGGNNCDYFAVIDASGYLWVSWEYGTGTSNDSICVNRNSLKNGTWLSVNGYPQTVVPANYGQVQTCSDIVALSNGNMYLEYYSAFISVYGTIWNGTAWSSPVTISTYSPFNDYPAGGETYGKGSLVDSSDNIWIMYADQSSNIRVYERTNSTGAWSGGIVVSNTIAGCSPTLVYYQGTISLYWINNNESIWYETYSNSTGWSSTPSVFVDNLLNPFPVGCQSSVGYNGLLNSFPGVTPNNRVGFLFVTNSTIQSNTPYQVNYYSFVPLITLPQPLTVSLNSPTNGASQSSYTVTFQYTPVIGGIAPQNASLWANVGGIWQDVENVMIVSNGTLNSITCTFASTPATIMWNVEVFNTTMGVFAPSNWVVTVGTILSSGGGQPATFYLRSDTWTINTVFGYQLGQSETGSLSQYSMLTSYAPLYGIRVWVVTAQGQATELTSGTPVAQILAVNGTSAYFGYWQGTAYPNPVSALEIGVYISLNSGSTWQLQATSITTLNPVLAQTGTSLPIISGPVMFQIPACTWTFEYNVNYNATAASTTLMWGNNADPTALSLYYESCTPYQIQQYSLSSQDLFAFILAPWSYFLGTQLTFAIILLIMGGGVYVREPEGGNGLVGMAIIFILFGGSGGMISLALPSISLPIAWAFLVTGVMLILYRFVRGKGITEE
jgi:hypothetical protein